MENLFKLGFYLLILFVPFYFLGEIENRILYKNGRYRWTGPIKEKKFRDKLIYVDYETVFKDLVNMGWIKPVSKQFMCGNLTEKFNNVDYEELHKELRKIFLIEDANMIGHILHECYLERTKQIEKLFQFLGGAWFFYWFFLLGVIDKYF